MEHVVGIGEWAISDKAGDVIKTFALSTCVGIVYYSDKRRCMGLAHIQLPQSKGVLKPRESPSRYADLAPAFLLKQMATHFLVTKGDLLVSLYGGIDGHGEKDYFRIGEKNLKETKASLKKIGLAHADVDTGGAACRTLFAHVSNGIVEVFKRPMMSTENFVRKG